MWRGWTSEAAADDYERFLLDELFPSMRRISGFRGAQVLRRPEAGSVAFVILTRFESIEDVQAFAGANWDQPVIEPRSRQAPHPLRSARDALRDEPLRAVAGRCTSRRACVGHSPRGPGP